MVWPREERWFWSVLAVWRFLVPMASVLYMSSWVTIGTVMQSVITQLFVFPFFVSNNLGPFPAFCSSNVLSESKSKILS